MKIIFSLYLYRKEKKNILLHPDEKNWKKILTATTAVIKDKDGFPLSREWHKRNGNDREGEYLPSTYKKQKRGEKAKDLRK